MRLEPVPRNQLDPELSATLDVFIKGAPEFNPMVFQTMGHNPEVSKAFYNFYIPIRTESRLDVKLKELVRLKIAQLNDCSTWKRTRTAQAVQEGMTEAMVEALGQVDASPDFTSREKLALQFAELMAVNHKQIDDDFFAALQQEFSAAQIIELGLLIGVFIGYGRLLSVLDLETPTLTTG